MPLEKLLAGFAGFRDRYMRGNAGFRDLVEKGQRPDTLVIACSDSRNDPAILTHAAPGDLFVVRNVAAIVPPFAPDGGYHGTSAAIEFAVKGLGVKHIIVLGHSGCGGAMALRKPEILGTDYQFLLPWVSIGTAARDAVAATLGSAEETCQQRAIEQGLIVTSLSNLMTFPCIAERVTGGKLDISGWYFDMAIGALLAYDAAGGAFISVADHAPTLPAAPCCADDAIKILVAQYAERQT